MKGFAFFAMYNPEYKLINIHKYIPHRTYTEKAIFIDPSVQELRTHNEYTKIELLHSLLADGLPSNVYMSIDYPSDMNMEMQDIFIQRTYKNNVRYKDNVQYICTPQHNFMDFESFYTEFERVRYIWEDNPDKIIGIGNMCRLIGSRKYHDYVADVLGYIQCNFKGRWVHVYGAPKWIIKWYKKELEDFCFFTTDNTKWTRAHTVELREKYGKWCSWDTHRLFYEEYIKDFE